MPFWRVGRDCKWSGGPSGGLGGVGRSSQRDGRGWQAVLEGQEGSGDRTKGPGGVRRPSQRDGGWEALPEVREWTASPSEGP